MKFSVVTALLICISSYGWSWGSWAHKTINRRAVENLPKEMQPFYNKHVDWIEQHSVDPDNVRDAEDSTEAPNHYIDIDYYGRYPFDELPRNFNDAVGKFTLDTLVSKGIVPWRIVAVQESLTNAMREKNITSILKWSAWLGHYVGDAHQPLHATLNYDGQYSNQTGIHWRFESAMTKKFGDTYLFPKTETEYVHQPLSFAFDIVLESYTYLDSVLAADVIAREQTVALEMKALPQFGDAYYTLLNEKAGTIANKQIHKAIQRVANLWYTAWVNAGKPALD
ncbi:MAG: zinc dependent phospholipase C family protein [Ignavibacteriales bacterium]|nr:zinc dependent phospholipase C family protein [Ignavibacteriales bacterium]